MVSLSVLQSERLMVMIEVYKGMDCRCGASVMI